jgi:hypothetical protein
MQTTKLQAIKYMGGKCIICGYSRCLRALHFHHIDPQDKEFDISTKTNWFKIKEELEKCILVCANCHMEIHDGLIDHEFIADIAER